MDATIAAGRCFELRVQPKAKANEKRGDTKIEQYKKKKKKKKLG